MTKVKIKKQAESIVNIVISGHAMSAEYGQDLVCAGISSVVTGICNALDTLSNYDTSKIIMKAGYVEIPDVSRDEREQLILQVLIVQLKTIEEVYPDYIEISYL